MCTKLLSWAFASCINSNCILQFPSFGSSGSAFPAGQQLSPQHSIPSLQNIETTLALALLAEETADLGACLLLGTGPTGSGEITGLAWVTATGTQRCYTWQVAPSLCSFQQQLLPPALCHISWPQQAVHTAQEKALVAAGWAEATPRPWRQRIEMKIWWDCNRLHPTNSSSRSQETITAIYSCQPQT